MNSTSNFQNSSVLVIFKLPTPLQKTEFFSSLHFYMKYTPICVMIGIR